MSPDDANQTLFHAVKTNDAESFDLALGNGASVTATNHYLETPLHVAAYRGNAGLARSLIELGADVNARDEDRETPLHMAAAGGHAEIVRLLLAKQADANACNAFEQLPLHVAKRFGRSTIAQLLSDTAHYRDGDTPISNGHIR